MAGMIETLLHRLTSRSRRDQSRAEYGYPGFLLPDVILGSLRWPRAAAAAQVACCDSIRTRIHTRPFKRYSRVTRAPVAGAPWQLAVQNLHILARLRYRVRSATAGLLLSV